MADLLAAAINSKLVKEDDKIKSIRVIACINNALDLFEALSTT